MKTHYVYNPIVNGEKRYSSLSFCMNDRTVGRVKLTEKISYVNCKKCLLKIKNNQKRLNNEN